MAILNYNKNFYFKIKLELCDMINVFFYFKYIWKLNLPFLIN